MAKNELKTASPNPSVFNRQRRLPVRSAELQPFLARLAGRLDLEATFSVILISDSAMQRLNRRFAGKDRATDVLSFPTSSEDRQIEPYLGDIFISVETADRQKKGTVNDEISVLALHGLLHLLGHDHETDQGEMEELESRLRVELGLRR